MRSEMLAVRDALTPGERREKSAAIHAALAAMAEVRRARQVMTYLHFRSEVETLPGLGAVLSPGCRIAVPRTVVTTRELEVYQLTDPVRQLRPGYCGIPEPDPRLCLRLDPAALDLVLVPGSAFDRRGGRLGYGGGYYDRFLAFAAPQAVRIGLAFACQVSEEPLALQAHDQLMHYLVTEKGVVACR